MAELGTLSLTLTAEEKQLLSSLAKAEKQAQKTGKTIAKSIDKGTDGATKSLTGLEQKSRKTGGVIGGVFFKQHKLKIDSSALDQVKAKAKGLGPGMTAIMSGVGAAAGTALIGAISSAVSAGINGIGAIIRTGMENQNFEMKVSVLNQGDVKQTKKDIQFIKDYGKVSPLDDAEIQKSLVVLKGFNVESAKSHEMIKRLGDVSSIAGKPLNELSRIYGQINAAQKVTMEDVNQLSEAGFPFLTEGAKNAGMSVEEFRKKIERGEVTVKDFDKVLTEQTSKGGLYFNGAIKASETLSGRLSTLSGSMQQFSTIIFNAFGKAFGGALGFVNKFFERLNVSKSYISEVNKIGEELSKAFGMSDKEAQNLEVTLVRGVIAAARNIRMLVQDVLKYLRENPGVLKDIQDIWKLITTLAGAVLQLVIDAWNRLKPWIPVLVSIAAILSRVLKFVLDVVGGINKAARESETLNGIWNTVHGVVKSVVDWVNKIDLGKMWNGFLDGAKKTLDWLNQNIFNRPNPGQTLGQQAQDEMNAMMPQGGAGGGNVGPLGGGSASLNQAEAIGHQFGLGTSSGFRRGDGGYHGLNRARDLSGNSSKQLAYAQHMARMFGSSITELIYTPLGFGIKNGKRVGLDFWGPAVNKDHFDHVHIAFNKGGVVPGTGNTDSVPAMLTPGEMVIPIRRQSS